MGDLVLLNLLEPVPNPRGIACLGKSGCVELSKPFGIKGGFKMLERESKVEDDGIYNDPTMS